MFFIPVASPFNDEPKINDVEYELVKHISQDVRSVCTWNELNIS